VLVADGNASFAGIVGELLDDEPGFSLVGTARTGQEVVDVARACRPDVVLVDERLDGSLHSEVLPRLRDACPSAVVLLWSHHVVHTAVTDVDGVLERGMTFRELVRAVRAALRSRTVLDLTDGAQPGVRTT
jgi:DNA-binding NarL/FixJ family response regulator